MRPWGALLLDWGPGEITPRGWQLNGFMLLGNGSWLNLSVEKPNIPFTRRVLIIELKECTGKQEEIRKKWLKDLIVLELMYAVSEGRGYSNQNPPVSESKSS